ncbi:MAG: cupin domain-containing protein [Chloroflexi bacterium]|nr:cupin domain-containing protein [Chloroflexota bacterium]MBV9135351.1 cupin domain-containing protein [Chloroflexota bacterium]
MTQTPAPVNSRAAAYVLEPGEVRRQTNSWPGTKADSSDTAGLLSVFEDTLEPCQFVPPLHLHTDMDEVLYVLEGALLVRLGEQQREVTTGSFVWIPRGTPHAFANANGTPTRLLSVATPGGIEQFFAEQSAYFAHIEGPPDLAILNQIAARHGGRMLGPPIRETR